MREIKFRGQLKEKGMSGWIEGSLVHITRTYKGEEDEQECDIYQIINEDGVVFFIDKETIGQFTGLHDKNEKEIYEGDIVRFEDIGEDGYEYKEGFDFKNEAQVIYEDGQVTLTNFGEGDNSYYANDGQPDILDEILRNGNCEVIGNIYDNPELLKGEQS